MSPVASKLPEELLEEILVRLPSRALIRFKTVSKQWLKLTTNNRFLVRQHSMAKARNLVFVLVPRQSFLSSKKRLFDYVSISPDHAVTNINVPGVGMREIKLVSVGFGFYCFYKEVNEVLQVQLWNPATMECIDVPSPTPPPDFEVYCRPSICFGEVDYEDGVFSYNVGMVTPSVHNFRGPMQWFQLYSSKTKSWTFTFNVYECEFLSCLSCVNLNGKAHWLNHCIVDGDEVTKITAFHYYDQAIRQIPVRLVPEVGKYNWWESILSLWDETFICLALCWEKDENLFIDIWVMREYMVDTSFIKEFTLGPFYRYDRLLGISGKLRILFLQSERDSSLILYDLKSSSMKEFSPPSGQYEDYWVITEHVESLVSLFK